MFGILFGVFWCGCASVAEVSLDEIPLAFKESKVLRFDGFKLLPDTMFNATLTDIVRLSVNLEATSQMTL